MTTDDRIAQLHDRAVRDLIEAHKARQDEPLVLAVRYQPGEDTLDIGLLEVLQGFPGGDDDVLLPTDFEASAQLRIFGKLHLVLGSPAQVRAAIARNDAEIQPPRRGTVVYDNGSQDALLLKGLLQL